MMILVCYDVNTETAAGRKRLTKIAKTCVNYGQRVQYSLFECSLYPDKWEFLKAKLLDIYDPEKDSLRFYYLGSNWKRRVEHHGNKKELDIDGPIIC